MTIINKNNYSNLKFSGRVNLIPNRCKPQALIMEAKKSINTSVEKKNILLDFILQLKTEHTLSYILQE